MSAHPCVVDGGVDVCGKEGDEHGDCRESDQTTAGGTEYSKRDREFQKARREDQRPGERHERWQHQGHRLSLDVVTEAEESECERDSQHAAEPHSLTPPDDPRGEKREEKQAKNDDWRCHGGVS